MSITSVPTDPPSYCNPTPLYPFPLIDTSHRTPLPVDRFPTSNFLAETFPLTPSHMSAGVPGIVSPRTSPLPAVPGRTCRALLSRPRVGPARLYKVRELARSSVALKYCRIWGLSSRLQPEKNIWWGKRIFGSDNMIMLDLKCLLLQVKMFAALAWKVYSIMSITFSIVISR